MGCLQGISKEKIRLERYLDMRYEGQSYEIIVPFDADYVERFHKLHEKTYGYMNEDKAIESVTWEKGDMVILNDPFLVNEYSIRRGTGGNVRHKGGDGIVREIELLSDVQVPVLSERRKIPPYGLFGGKPGDVGKNIIFRKKLQEHKEGKLNPEAGWAEFWHHNIVKRFYPETFLLLKTCR